MSPSSLPLRSAESEAVADSPRDARGAVQVGAADADAVLWGRIPARDPAPGPVVAGERVQGPQRRPTPRTPNTFYLDRVGPSADMPAGTRLRRRLNVR